MYSLYNVIYFFTHDSILVGQDGVTGTEDDDDAHRIHQGEGNVLGAILGALILTLITNGMNLMNISSQAQPLVTGAVIVFAVFLDTKMKSVEARKAGKLAIA